MTEGRPASTSQWATNTLFFMAFWFRRNGFALRFPKKFGSHLRSNCAGIASLAASAAQRKNTASNGLARVEYVFDGLASWPEQCRQKGRRPVQRDAAGNDRAAPDR
jgi:hypothetical protein